MLQSSDIDCSWRPIGKSWRDHKLACPGVGLTSIASTKPPEIRAEFWLRGDDFETLYAKVLDNKAGIESELKRSFFSDPLIRDKSSLKVYTRKDADIFDRRTWFEQHVWLQENLETLARVFVPWIERLRLEIYRR